MATRCGGLPLSGGVRGYGAIVSKAVVGQEWVDKYPDRFVGREPRSPGPCIICGAPDCTCTPEPETPDA